MGRTCRSLLRKRVLVGLREEETSGQAWDFMGSQEEEGPSRCLRESHERGKSQRGSCRGGRNSPGPGRLSGERREEGKRVRRTKSILTCQESWGMKGSPKTMMG